VKGICRCRYRRQGQVKDEGLKHPGLQESPEASKVHVHWMVEEMVRCIRAIVKEQGLVGHLW